jgi:nucleoside-diphosphate-sugar epimerase
MFDGNLAKARASNVEPVRWLIEMLEKRRDARLVHLSTTWVCGTKGGLFTEFDLACQQSFYNAYEQSKYEAECLLKNSSVADRVIIIRRSLTVDMSNFADEAAVTTFESVLASLQTTPRIAVLGDSRARIDVIPIEYLAAATVALAGNSSARGRTVHVVAGWGKSWTLGELVQRIRTRVSNSRVYYWPALFAAPVRLIGRLSFGRLLTLPRFAAALPYLRQRCVFDDYLATQLLKPLGLTCPSPEAFWHDRSSSASRQKSDIAATVSP